tara:strand:+ start:1061 stop:1825 length:765 start_codon:yes stop_codon:yes gene_type:complete
MSSARGPGRLGNQIFRSLACAIVAEKFNLKMSYQNRDEIEELGLTLFTGDKYFSNSEILRDNNYLRVLNAKSFERNIITQNCYFQTHAISSLIHKYLISDKISKSIIFNNIHKGRYNNNKDCFIHIRIGDRPHHNPGAAYYLRILDTIKFDNLYISSDTPGHSIINTIQESYPNMIFYNSEKRTDIIKFASTCKYVILSYGTFSAIIGYLSYYSYVYCLPFCKRYAWDWEGVEEFNTFQDKFSKIGKWIVTDEL